MASVFTFEPEPPKLTSPWGSVSLRQRRLDPSANGSIQRIQESSSLRRLGGLVAPVPLSLTDCGLTKLESEPQEGPTEYKQHLLLRPRRSFLVVSTGEDTSDQPQGRAATPLPGVAGAASEPLKPAFQTPMSPQPSSQTRQNRFHHLTTQLLWRLQQSSPYHSSSAANLVIPRLPDANSTPGVPARPEQLLPGLESSCGALYEIGVADDGAFVGLTEDELDESFRNLQAMAASLGCNVEIIRLVIVGDCEWINQDFGSEGNATGGEIRKGALFVAEALVLPDTHPRSFDNRHSEGTPRSGLLSQPVSSSEDAVISPQKELSHTEQLRVSLTGRTTAGKSSLLGTISTSTLDNGRGKSRLSLLKHRHEIATGITSSVAPELIGYAAPAPNKDGLGNIINYSSGNISSWDDIHSAAEGGRLVFLTDSAGHPRYRRTIVRGLVSWAPHWTLCCIPADEKLNGSAALARSRLPSEPDELEDISRSSFAHLGLCLKLRLPLIVVITKQDHATRENLRQCLSKILSITKTARRKPYLIVRPGANANTFASISPGDEHAAQTALAEELSRSDSHIQGQPFIKTVPIILTSSLNGNGIGQLHALLRAVPIPPLRQPQGATPATLFHIDELYSLPRASTAKDDIKQSLVVVSGHLRYGSLSVGDAIRVGPFNIERSRDGLKTDPVMERTRSNPSKDLFGSPPHVSRSMPRLEQHSWYTPPPSTPTLGILQGEFFSARVVSVRNLRFPLRTLLQDQVGTVGIEFSPKTQPLVPKLRKGMILAGPDDSVQDSIRPCAAVQVRFHDDDYEIMEPGAVFNLYVASIRTVAKILTVEAVSTNSQDSISLRLQHHVDEPSHSEQAALAESSAEEAAFGEMEDHIEHSGLHDDQISRRMIDVVFHFLHYPEWIEQGAQVLAMPGQAIAGGIGLDGFVGYVVETRD